MHTHTCMFRGGLLVWERLGVRTTTTTTMPTGATAAATTTTICVLASPPATLGRVSVWRTAFPSEGVFVFGVSVEPLTFGEEARVLDQRSCGHVSAA